MEVPDDLFSEKLKIDDKGALEIKNPNPSNESEI